MNQTLLYYLHNNKTLEDDMFSLFVLFFLSCVPFSNNAQATVEIDYSNVTINEELAYRPTVVIDYDNVEINGENPYKGDTNGLQ